MTIAAASQAGSTGSARLLVTGAAGFVGQHVLRFLGDQPRFEVHATSRSSRPAGNARWHSVDLLQHGEASRLMDAIAPTHLLHLAWYTEHQHYWTSPVNLAWTTASLDLLAAFSAAGGRRAVFAGTCAEYALGAAAGPCREDVTPERPDSLYGACKLAVNRLGQAFAAAQGFEFAWGRIFYVFGPGEPRTRLIPSIVASLGRGERARCFRGADVKDYIYVGDVAAALIALLDSRVTGPVNIATGTPVRLEDLVRLVGSRAGRPELVDIAAPSAPPAVVAADVTRLTTDVGWTPGYPLVRGLDETIAWLRS